MADKSRKRLSVLQSKFIDAYMGPAEFNAAEAARMAGYSNRINAPTRILDIPMVEEELRRRCLRIAPSLRMSGDDIIAGLSRIASDTRSAAEGGPTIMARARVLRELGLIRGLYTNKIQVTGSLTLIDLLLGATQLVENRSEQEAIAAPQIPAPSEPVYELPQDEEPMYG